MGKLNKNKPSPSKRAWLGGALAGAFFLLTGFACEAQGDAPERVQIGDDAQEEALPPHLAQQLDSLPTVTFELEEIVLPNGRTAAEMLEEFEDKGAPSRPRGQAN